MPKLPAVRAPGGVASALGPVIRAARNGAVGAVRRYHRLTVTGPSAPLPDEPTLFVANHGFGGVVDLNVLATLAALDGLALTRPVAILTHQLAWTLRVGPLLENLGARQATWANATAALDGGGHVLVLPGGDIDASKTFRHRNRVEFGGRTGFARLALATGVPMVPIVTRGTGNTLLVLNDGRRLARLLHADELLRMNALPITVSVPWGLNAGVVGLIPYLPLPARLRTAVLDPVRPLPAESAAELAARVVALMQAGLDGLGRSPASSG